MAVKRWQLPCTLRQAQATTNSWESVHSQVRTLCECQAPEQRGPYLAVGLTSASLLIEVQLHRLLGYRDLPVLQAQLHDAIREPTSRPFTTWLRPNVPNLSDTVSRVLDADRGMPAWCAAREPIPLRSGLPAHWWLDSENRSKIA